jgi:hypothetical protein
MVQGRVGVRDHGSASFGHVNERLSARRRERVYEAKLTPPIEHVFV